MSVQYRVVVTKQDERAEGPDDADIVMTVPAAVALADEFDATVEFMRGRLKAVGHSGQVLDLLKPFEGRESCCHLRSSLSSLNQVAAGTSR